MANPSRGPPPPGGDVNRAAETYAFTWALCSAALIFTMLRAYTRSMLTRNVWWDDWFIFFTMLCSITFSVLWTVYAADGYARHGYYLTPSQLIEAGKLNWISRPFCIISIATGKVSVVFLIARIQAPSKWRTWLLWAIGVSVSVFGSISVILIWSRCTPYYALWNPQMIKSGKAHCINITKVNQYDTFTAGYYTFLDLLLALLPITIIYKLQISNQKKALLCTLLGMGILAGIFAAFKTATLRGDIKKTDVTWLTIDLFLWNALEINLIIIAACIPTLRPLFLIIFRQPGASAYKRNSKPSYKLKPQDSATHCEKCGRSRDRNPGPAHRAMGSVRIDETRVAVHNTKGSLGGESETGLVREVNVGLDEDDGDRRHEYGYIPAHENMV